LSGAFVNPDHFAAWLEMLICLGIGYVLARSRPPEDARAAWSSRRAREQLIRRSLPMIAIAVMALALVFTLSRGGVVSIAVALAALLALQGFAGRVRSSLVLVGLLLALTAGYGAWIGLEPLLERFRAISTRAGSCSSARASACSGPFRCSASGSAPIGTSISGTSRPSCRPARCTSRSRTMTCCSSPWSWGWWGRRSACSPRGVSPPI
jgi:hypothetical protein